MESIQLVRYTPEHLEAILELHRSEVASLKSIIGSAIGIDEDEEETDLRSIERIYIDNGGDFLVGLLDGVVIAMGGFMPLSGTAAELRRMRIRKDLQGKGFGGQLLKELEFRAFQSGIRELSFETAKARQKTLEFYRNHGYQETGSGFYGNVETVHFSKTLG